MPVFLPFFFADHALYEGAPKVPAAIVLPVKVEGTDCYAQLDTGAPGAVIWHSKGKVDAPRKDVTVELAGLRRTASADAANLALLEQGRCTSGLIATIGNEFFEQGTLELDLAGSRYRWQQGAVLQGAPDAQTMRYVRWGGPGGHPLVTVRVAGGATVSASPAYAMDHVQANASNPTTVTPTALSTRWPRAPRPRRRVAGSSGATSSVDPRGGAGLFPAFVNSAI